MSEASETHAVAAEKTLSALADPLGMLNTMRARRGKDVESDSWCERSEIGAGNRATLRP